MLPVHIGDVFAYSLKRWREQQEKKVHFHGCVDVDGQKSV
jgi:hypothetical protein